MRQNSPLRGSGAVHLRNCPFLSRLGFTLGNHLTFPNSLYMAFRYLLYGLNLRSDLPLPALWECAGEVESDVEITFHKLHQITDVQRDPWYISPYLDENGKPYLTVWKAADDSAFHFLYGDQTEFLVDQDGSHVSATWPPSLNLENTTVYLTGQIAAFILRLRGLVCLHASSILVDSKVIAIAGESGSGKSSAAACLTTLGYSVLSEDVTTLVNGSTVQVLPGYPRINLWPDVEPALRGTTDSLPRIAPTWNKRYLDLRKHGGGFWDKPAPLGGVYVLGDRRSGESAPSIEKLESSDALVSLLANAHGRYLLEKSMRVREFEVLSQVARQIPVCRVIPHKDLYRLNDLCETIIDDFRNSLPSNN